MCNPARLSTEPETLFERFGATWAAPVPNRWPIELAPKGRAPVIRSADGQRIIDVMSWDVLGGNGPLADDERPQPPVTATLPNAASASAVFRL